MTNCEVKILKIRKGAKVPTYGSVCAAGADLYACLEENTLTILPGKTVMVHTGIAMEIPEGYAGFIYARSSLAAKKGLAPANKVGVIDSDYRGEIMVALHNHSDKEAVIENGERVAQIIFAPFLRAFFIETEDLAETSRGEGGFGSTGRK